MPQVPIAQGRQLRDAPLQGGFVQAPDAGRDLARASQALGAVAEATDRIDLRNTQTRANEIDTQITSEWLQWDAENRAKFRGANVDGYAPAAQEWWKKAAETYGKDLDPRTRELASQSLMRKQQAALGSVLQFTASEKERHAVDTFNAKQATAVQFGISTGDVAGTAAQIRTDVAAFGAGRGWTTEQVQAEQLRVLSQLHVAQIAKLAETDANAAQAYYTANKAEVPAAQQARIETVLKGEADNQFAQQFAAANASKPLAEQLAEAGKISDPQRRDKALQQVKMNHTLVKEAEADRQRQFSDKAWQMVGAGQRVPEAILIGMDGRERVQLQDYLRQRAERGPAPVKTNPAELARVYDMARENPDEFKKLRMQALTNTIAPNDLEQIARLQRDMNKPDREKDVATTTQLMSTYTGGWKPEKRAVFQQAAFDELDRFEKEKGRPANYDEKKKVFDRLMLDGEVLSGAWYKIDPNKKFYEATPEERKRFAPTISSDDRKLVVEALKAEGVASPTDEQIVARFKLAKGIR